MRKTRNENAAYAAFLICLAMSFTADFHGETRRTKNLTRHRAKVPSSSSCLREKHDVGTAWGLTRFGLGPVWGLDSDLSCLTHPEQDVADCSTVRAHFVTFARQRRRQSPPLPARFHLPWPTLPAPVLRSGASREASPLWSSSHQRQQPAQLAGRKALAREPGQVRPGQVGDQPAPGTCRKAWSA